MKYRILSSIIFAFCAESAFAQDAIIFRDGHEKSVKIIQTSNDKTIFKDNEKGSVEQTVDNKDIFMLKFKTRGNVVFDSNGERISSTSTAPKLPKDAVIIYFKDGRETAVYNLTMNAQDVTYWNDKKGKGGIAKAAKDDIFLIKYPDGTRDLLADIKPEEKDNVENTVVAQESNDSVEVKAVEKVKPSVENPVKATIITKKGIKIEVWLCSEYGKEVTYKKENSPGASIFRMNKGKIKTINY